jgi:hypothetical protein
MSVRLTPGADGTWKEKKDSQSGWGSLTYDEIAARDKRTLDICWLKDASLDRGHLPFCIRQPCLRAAYGAPRKVHRSDAALSARAAPAGLARGDPECLAIDPSGSR